MLQATLLAKACSPLMLNQAIVNYKRENPTANTAAAMKNVVKYTVPISLPGSPSWHRKQLNDLLFLVQEWGMPHFFLTMTCHIILVTRPIEDPRARMIGVK